MVALESLGLAVYRPIPHLRPHFEIANIQRRYELLTPQDY